MRPFPQMSCMGIPYLLLRWLAVFECVNESDEKGD